jgi:plastocyanin
MAMGGGLRSSLQAMWLCALGLAAATQSAAATLEARAVDHRGQPVPAVAIYAVPRSQAGSPAHAGATDVMDQQHNAFVPHVLVVQTGTSVLFPNSDTVSHHVYSFSEAKSFELGLYKGNAYPPLTFDKPGVVVLGCNIHDGMLGYILVVDTPHFALTDDAGRAVLESLPPGTYDVHAWTPRAKPADAPSPITVEIATGQTVTFTTGKLQPAHDHGGAGLTWQPY